MRRRTATGRRRPRSRTLRSGGSARPTTSRAASSPAAQRSRIGPTRPPAPSRRPRARAPAAHARAACDGPPPAAQPNTPEWTQREADNVECGEQRSRDTQSNPAYTAAAAQLQAERGGPVAEDPSRDPARLDGKRFRYEP